MPPKGRKIKIALAEDHNLYRKALADAIQYSNNNFNVVFHVPNGQELIYELRKNPVDVIILDIQMPVMCGKEALKIIRTEFPSIKIVILSMLGDDLTIAEFVKRGVHAFLPKHCDIEDLLDAIYGVLDQGYYFNNLYPVDLLDEMIQMQVVVPKDETEPLSEREIDVLRLTCQEKTSKQISEKLFISVRTVENHRNHINSKVGARNSIGLLVYALHKGLVRITADKRVVFD
jgi:DNA-binding NarL/FixJ family response regulator